MCTIVRGCIAAMTSPSRKHPTRVPRCDTAVTVCYVTPACVIPPLITIQDLTRVGLTRTETDSALGKAENARWWGPWA
eukprot:318895-Amorphochlora_amoeboformis.AAC.1